MLATDHIPEGFLQTDLIVDGARHVIFASPEQLTLLAQAKTWYVDGTFNVIRSTDVFEQLFGIHAFIKKDGDTKQVPLVFVFLSKRQKKDYKKVLKKIKSALPTNPVVESFVLDFELAVRNAIRSVFPGVSVVARSTGRKLSGREFRLSTQYKEDGSVRKMVQRVLALPLLPAQHITTAFHQLKTKAEDNPRLDDVFTYVKDQWVDNFSWKPEDWSVYGKPVRTNNDCEGWHRRLNYRTVSPPPFYVLVNLLHKEASFVKTQVKQALYSPTILET